MKRILSREITPEIVVTDMLRRQYQVIMAMYSKGMSQRDIEDTLKDIYGTDISQGMISKITDRILPEVNEWQNRPLDSIYPVVFFDGIVFNSRKDNKIISKCV